MASASHGTFKSREDFKKAKELEEARKAGTALPEVDEDGNDINPHIPQYISQAPWYLNMKGPSLKHQRNLLEQRRNFDGLEAWYPRGQDAKRKEAPTKWKAGSCTNCGSSTHNAKNCFELPRKVGAKWSGKHLRAGDVVRRVNLGWEAKRDRWNGYNPDDYRHVVKRYQRLESEREKLRLERGEEEEEEERTDAGAVVTSGGGEGRVVARNLRIREDTAKYLHNLDENSAYYDPKTRSMRADPTPHIDPEDKDYAGDNFERYTGDVVKIANQQLHALEAAEAGREVPHMLAEPTRAEATFREFERKKKTLNEQRRKQILEQYGGAKYFEKPKPLVEAEKAAIARGPAEKAKEKFDRNHTARWGSYSKDGRAGYACCHQMTRNSYCTGESGKEAARKVEEKMAKRMKEINETEEKRVKDHEEAVAKRKRDKEPSLDKNVTAEERRVRRKVEQEIRAQVREDRKNFEPDDRKRAFNSRFATGSDRDGYDISEKDMEAYRIRRHVAEDPMADYLEEKEKRQSKSSKE